mmetsp:Transcript_4199/g.11406  ORF Transcript_4199/g.11406 Transcript_4199/m.11406 type:complete len:264 (-) Transcript_4199:10-801(-)
MWQHLHPDTSVPSVGMSNLTSVASCCSKNSLMSWQVSAGKDGDTHHFVSNKSPNSHHCRAALVQFNGALLELGCFIQLIPSKVQGTIAVVTREGRISRHVAVASFRQEGKEDHLTNHVQSVGRISKGRKGLQSVGDAFGARESDSGSGGQVANDGEHGNTTVLDFAFAEFVKVVLVAIGNQVERIPVAEGSDNSGNIGKGLGPSVQGRSLVAGLLGGSKGGGGGQEGGKNGSLHGGWQWGVKEKGNVVSWLGQCCCLCSIPTR